MSTLIKPHQRTNPAWRRQGLAKFLVDRVFEEAKSNRFSSVKASTDEDSKTVCRVFERCGFNMVEWESCGVGGKKTMIYYQNSQ